ncbi:nicotinate (nicotinamide) nucleotide adenylyltransferase [Sulfurospirillum sp. 1307]
MKIAIFGGSFDPLHVGHLAIIDEALKSLHVNKLFVVPAYLNPFKKNSFAPADLRLKWLQKALFGHERIEILDYEIEQNKPTPSIKTVLHVKEKYKDIEKIYLIIGADNLESLDKWKDYEELKKLVTFVVASRDEINIPKDLKKLSINVNISSSNLREKIDDKFLPNTLKEEIKKYYTRIKMEKRIEKIVTILDSKKAENIQIFDMKGKDYFVEQVVIATTMGQRHGLALLDDLKKGLKNEEEFLNIDDDNEWIVIDLGDILIHLMSQHYRSKYDIEEFLNQRENELKKIRAELED